MDVIERLKSDVASGPRGRIGEIAAGSGVSIKTLRNIWYGYTKDITYSNARKLAEYYLKHERRMNPDRRRETRL